MGGRGGCQLSFLGEAHWDLDMKMQDAAFAECWVSIIQGCSVTALYLCPPLSHHYLTSLCRKSCLLVTPWGHPQLLIFCIFAFDCRNYSPDSPSVSHLANLRQGRRQTVWSTAGQTGTDIWSPGIFVPVRPHTDPKRDHRSDRHGEQESN